MLFETPESGKKSDVNGGRKLASDLTPQQREARLDYLMNHYNDPSEEGVSPFDEDGLIMDPSEEGLLGSAWAEPEAPPAEVGATPLDESRFFTVNRTPAWGVEFDPSKVPADI